MVDLDFTGLSCPMPVIKLKKFLAQNPDMTEPFVIRLSDSGGLKDIPAFCDQQGLSCQLNPTEECVEFTLQRVGKT